MCVCKWPLVMKLLPQSSKEQMNGLSLVCALKCVLRLPVSLKFFMQCGYEQKSILFAVDWPRSTLKKVFASGI